MGVRPFFRWPSSWSFRNCGEAQDKQQGKATVTAEQLGAVSWC